MLKKPESGNSGSKGLFGYAAFDPISLGRHIPTVYKAEVQAESHAVLVTGNGTSVGFIWKITSISG